MCRVLEWMERTENWLLVLDGANAVDEGEIDDLKACLPTSRGSSILFTTLNQSLDGQARLGAPVAYKIPQMTMKEAIAILLTEAKITDPTPQEMKVAGELVELLDYLIGAIHIAACYIAERQVSIYEYLRGYKEHPKVSGDGWSPLAMTLDTLETKHPEAANLLKLISFFGTDIPTLLIHWGLEALPTQVRVVAKEEDGMLDFNLTIKHLLAFSLVRRSHQKEGENGKEWRVDRLHLQSVIQTYVRQRLAAQADIGQAWVKFAALVFRYAFEKAERQRGHGGVYIKDYEEFLLHGDPLMQYLREQKVSRRSIRITVERARMVIEDQIRAQEAGRLIEYPIRSIWGRGDMESPEALYASRRSTFDGSSSATGSSLSASTLSEISKGNTFSVGNNSKVTQAEVKEEKGKAVETKDIANPTLSRASTSNTIRPSTSSVKGKYQGKKLQRRPSHRSYRARREKAAAERKNSPESTPSTPKAIQNTPEDSSSQRAPPPTDIKLPPQITDSASVFSFDSPFSPHSPGAATPTSAITTPHGIFIPFVQHVPQVYTSDLVPFPPLPHRTLSEPVRDPGPGQPLPRTIRRRRAVDLSTKGKQKEPEVQSLPPIPASPPPIAFYPVPTHDFDSNDEDFVSVASEPGPSRLSHSAMRHKILYPTPVTSTTGFGIRRKRAQREESAEEFLSAPTSPKLSRMGSVISDISSMRASPGSLVNLLKEVKSWASRSRGSSTSSATASPSVTAERRMSRDASPDRGLGWGRMV
ncbi:hypothetical protein ABW19_dt0201474 [Dactylella cylindrospora]|nr:hypothetical protein ABW19_dt0201474 [Dactylella cylindrospora]